MPSMRSLTAVPDISSMNLPRPIHRQAEQSGRSAWVIAESDLNDVRVLKTGLDGGYGFDAQWHEDFHHSLHAVLAKENRGYMADFGKLQDLRKASL